MDLALFLIILSAIFSFTLSFMASSVFEKHYKLNSNAEMNKYLNDLDEQLNKAEMEDEKQRMLNKASGLTDEELLNSLQIQLDAVLEGKPVPPELVTSFQVSPYSRLSPVERLISETRYYLRIIRNVKIFPGY